MIGKIRKFIINLLLTDNEIIIDTEKGVSQRNSETGEPSLEYDYVYEALVAGGYVFQIWDDDEFLSELNDVLGNRVLEVPLSEDELDTIKRDLNLSSSKMGLSYYALEEILENLLTNRKV